MLYSGHFSFDEVGSQNNARHGYFTCVVDAQNPERALGKFKERIRQIRLEEKDPLFERITAIYIEEIVEIAESPNDAIVTRFQSSEGPFPKSQSCALPTSDTRKIRAYQWVPGSEAMEFSGEVKDKEGYEEETPLMQFT